MKNKKSFISALALICLIAVLFAGCSATGSGSDNYLTSTSSAGGTAAMPAPAAAPQTPAAYDAGERAMLESGRDSAPLSGGTAGSPQSSVVQEGRKIIRNATLSIESVDFDGAIDSLYDAVGVFGGHVQSSSVEMGNHRAGYGSRYAYFEIRIPSERLDEFLAQTNSIGNVLRISTSDEEITDTYFDIEARLQTLKIQQERLLAILEKTEELTDVIELEKALSNVLYEIESLTGTLRKYDGLIAYSTVRLDLSEVYEETPVNMMPKTLSERISQEWGRTMQRLRVDGEDFVVWFVGGLPRIALNLIIIAFIVAVIVIVLRATLLKGRVKNRRGATPPEKDDEPNDDQKK